jgi:MYXO-CTERM domain-containing protein
VSDARGERRFERTATATLFLLAVLLHVILSWQYRQDPFAVTLVADASSYDAWAARWAAGGSGGEPVFHQSPLFPWWLSWTHRLVGDGWRVATISGLQGLLNALAISLWVPLGRRWFGRSSVGLAAGLIALTFAPFYFHALKLLPVATALATQVVGLLCLSRADSPAPRPRSILSRLTCCGGASIWGVTVDAVPEPNSFALAAVAGLGLIGWRRRERRRRP